MTQNNFSRTLYPSYYELLQYNPLLKRKTETKVEELVYIIVSLGYYWDNQNLYFHNPEILNSIRTQGLDIFTAKSFREFHEDIIEEIKLDPEFYHKAGKSSYQFRKASSYISKIMIVILALGWFLFSLTTIISIIAALSFLWIVFLFRSNLNAKKKEKLRMIVFKRRLERNKVPT